MRHDAELIEPELAKLGEGSFTKWWRQLYAIGLNLRCKWWILMPGPMRLPEADCELQVGSMSGREIDEASAQELETR